MDKRYQVFVSSTYADLKEERARVIQTLIESDCIPAGMELFPATDEEQFEFIKRVIDDCDYYLLIIGGRYGSITAEGISYTEKEYEYAVSLGLKVIALIHANPEDIPLGKSEKDPVLRDRLQKFRDRVSDGRLVKFWKSAEDLPGLVSLSLAHITKRFPAVGWIRANKAASEDLLTEINDLRKKKAHLEGALAALAGSTPQPAIKNLAGMQDEFRLHGIYRNVNQMLRSWSATLTWGDIFGFVAPYLVRLPPDDYVKSILADAAFARSDESRHGDQARLDDQTFRTVAVQLGALGLVRLEYSQGTSGRMSLFWSLTQYGERLMIEVRTVKKAIAAEPFISNYETE